MNSLDKQEYIHILTSMLPDEYNQPRKRRMVHAQTLVDDLGVPFTINVDVDVEDWWLNGKWEETYPMEASRTIEAAIEKQRPGWFHRCGYNPDTKITTDKKDCPACQLRKKLKKSR